MQNIEQRLLADPGKGSLRGLQRQLLGIQTGHRFGNVCIFQAGTLEMDIRAYQDINATIQPIRDEAIDEAYSDHLMDFADQGERADQAMEREQMAAALKLAIDKLNEREQLILQLYFVEELNLDEIGQVLGVGAARVCQIKKSALTKVRAIMVEDEEDYA